MIGLWIAAALLSAGAAALIVQRAARRARRDGDAGPELAVYRRQMVEIDALADRGLIAEAERRAVRAETGRRLLAAAGRAERPLRAARPQLIVTLAALTPLLAAGAYLTVGAPGFGDQPFAKRLAAWREVAKTDPEALSPPQMAAILRAVSAERPAEPEPLRNLAIAELASDQPMEAVQALQRAIALAPRRADLWDALGRAEVAKANGDVGEDAQRAFHQALALAPQDVGARYFLARARIAGGDVVGGLAEWRKIEAGLAPDDPRKAQLAGEMQQVASAGALPPPAPAPPESAPQIGAPQIQAMVDGLAAQLKASPDNPAGWVQLVRAYTVLGETDRRDAALAEARRRYAGKSDVQAALDAAMRPRR